MSTDWNHAGTFTDTARYELRFSSNSPVVLKDDTGNAQHLKVSGRTHEFYQIGKKWLAEARTCFKDGITIYVILVQCKLPCGTALGIECSDGGKINEMTLSLEGTQKTEKKTFSSVFTVLIKPDEVCEVCIGADDKTGVQTQNTPMFAATSQPTAQSTIAPNEVNDLRRALEKEKKRSGQLQKLIVEAEDEKTAIQQALETERRTVEALKTAMSEQIDRSLAELTEAGQVQSGELHQKILELAQLTEVVNLTRAEVDAKTLEVSRMKGQLEEVESERARLESIFEQLTMDFDEATNNLQALKSVCGADLDTVAFMQEDPILKGNSVKKTLEYVQVELESAEKRLALLIRAKEQAGFAIQKTILNGDGAISLKEERGDNHVNRNEPESKDPGVGDTAGDD